ncbi:winged helix-turn-helix transcriptional regulator [Candidatus Woesearchaeota archaeon]|nr:winged helix-turn-helix transcriptional regulator [Candidatus Woesearchaeota archaeon]
MYEQELKDLGFTDNEVKIYLLLLENGMMNPAEISQKLGLHRGYVYDALERMQEKEIVNVILESNKKHYQANNPENLVELLKYKLENLKIIIPNLNKLSRLNKEVTKVELHKGGRTYRTLLKDIIVTLNKNEELLLIGVDEQNLIENVEPIYLKQYFNIIASKNIKERVIMKKSKRSKLKPKNISYKYLDDSCIGNIEQLIYGNKVVLFIFGNPHNMIVIENLEVVETYKKQFELLWDIARK